MNLIAWFRDEVPPGLRLFWLIGVFAIAPAAVFFALWITEAI